MRAAAAGSPAFLHCDAVGFALRYRLERERRARERAQKQRAAEAQAKQERIRKEQEEYSLLEEQKKRAQLLKVRSWLGDQFDSWCSTLTCFCRPSHTVSTRHYSC